MSRRSGRLGVAASLALRSSPLGRIAAIGAGVFLLVVLLASVGATVVTQAACAPAGGQTSAPVSSNLTGVPKKLIPIYEAASEKYKLGEQGPAILAAINFIETNFGANQGPSTAGAVGWMQFMPATWEAYGVDADKDGKKDPVDPDDAIHAAARYLAASGAPGNWHDAIFAYNHAEWYVDDVLAKAKEFSGSSSQEIATETSTQTTSTTATVSAAGLTEPYQRFTLLVAEETGLSPRVIAAWVLAEGGPDDNPLNIGPGNHYGDVEGGARATVDLLGTSLYKGIMAAAKSGTDQEQIEAIVASPWCPGCAGYQQLLESVYDRVKVEGQVSEPVEASCKTPGEIAGGGQQIGKLGIGDPDPLALIKNPRITLDAEAIADLKGNHISPKLVAVLSAITEQHKITLSVLSTGHSLGSNHIPGRGADIAIVDGEVCNAPANGRSGACWTLAQELDAIEDKCYASDELIYYFDPGPSPGSFAMSDHNDHIHLGYNGCCTSSVLTYPAGTDPCSPAALGGG